MWLRALRAERVVGVSASFFESSRSDSARGFDAVGVSAMRTPVAAPAVFPLSGDVEEVVRDVWSSLAGSQVSRRPGASCACCAREHDAARPARTLRGRAVIAGLSPVRVDVCADTQSLAELAFAMTGSDEAADRVDALAELVNQVAGGVKGLLAEDASLTVPAVMPGCGPSECGCTLSVAAGSGMLCVSWSAQV